MKIGDNYGSNSEKYFISNGDNIRKMNNHQLAIFLLKIIENYSLGIPRGFYFYDSDRLESIERWLDDIEPVEAEQ